MLLEIVHQKPINKKHPVNHQKYNSQKKDNIKILKKNLTKEYVYYITRASGYLASHIIIKLLEQNFHVIG